MSFKKKIIVTNSIILIFFVSLLTYSAIEIVYITSKEQFRDIRSNILNNNKRLLLTFVRVQNIGLDKEINLIGEEVDHLVSLFTNQDKNEEFRNKLLVEFNTSHKKYIKSIAFVDVKNNEEYFVSKNKIINKNINLNFANLTKYKGFYIDKEIIGRNITRLHIYKKIESWGDSFLKFDMNLDYFAKALTFENMINKFHYRYFLVDEHGYVITSNLNQNTEHLMSDLVYDEYTRISVANYIMSKNRGSVLVNGLENPTNITFVKNNLTGWRLVLVTPEDVINSSYTTTKELVLSGDNSLIKMLALAYTILLSLFLIINSVAVNQMLIPFSKLIEQAKFLKQRDFDNATRLLHSRGDEIEQLSKAYCEAGIQIRSLVEGLEEEVKNRTSLYETAAEEASEANKQKSVLLSNVSHEIRTPLNAIIGYTHMLTHSEHFNFHKHQLNGISSASNTILGIVNDLLDFERIKASNFSLSPKPVSVKSLLDDVINTFLPLSQKKQLSLDVTCSVDASTILFIDALRIKQAIGNIVSNAIKFTERGGITIDISSDKQVFNISIIDTGVGIPEGKLESIFKGFEQVNQEDQQFGFGLGLAITKTIVELMNGTLHVESELGVGSHFRIGLPATEITGPMEDTTNIVQRDINGHNRLDYSRKRALIVDDVEFNREILEFHLNGMGFECMAASDGLEGVSLGSSNNFDIVLTDISMPRMDGLELAAKLSEIKPSLPIIAVTARATIQEKSLMNHYFSCYVTKPIDPIDLKSKIERVFSGGSC
ncbi:ATP-binding protein [Vibrio chagasii]|uniref:ATP-binding protein n=1 Tax=Vibrio chagasii TaxID=170679 RepID=UPI004069735F